MATGLIDVIKRAALEANDNSNPVDIRYGTVVSVSPLQVKITNQFTIPERMLVVPHYLTTFSLNIIIGDEEVVFDNVLKVGDKVALLRQAGGQSYFILDKI